MIVIIGSPVGRLEDREILAAGTPSRVALAAASAGKDVQLLGRTGDDLTADGLLLDLTRGGVGHVAMLRDPARVTPLEPAIAADDDPARTIEASTQPAFDTPARPILDAPDVDLGLRYLADYTVIVLAEPAEPGVVRVVVEASLRNAAQLLVVVERASSVSADLPPDAIVFEAPADDPDGDFAALVGRFAAALEDGTDAADAFRTSVAAHGWTASVPE